MCVCAKLTAHLELEHLYVLFFWVRQGIRMLFHHQLPLFLNTLFPMGHIRTADTPAVCLIHCKSQMNPYPEVHLQQ